MNKTIYTPQSDRDNNNFRITGIPSIHGNRPKNR